MKNILIITFCIFFNTSIFAIDINESIKNTIKNNTKIKIAIEELNESKEQIALSLTNFNPNITLDLKGEQSTKETTTNTSTTNEDKFSQTYSLNIIQNLYDGGKNNLDLARSKILYEKDIENFYQTLDGLILDAINGYLNVQFYEESLQATNKNFEVVDKIYRDALTQQDLGTLTIEDVKYSEASYELSKTNLELAINNLMIGQNTFKKIVGLQPSNLQDIFLQNENFELEKIIESAIKNNHKLKILDLDYKSSLLLLDIKKKNNSPSLDLSGDASYSDNVTSKGTETLSGSISAKLSIPLYDKGIVSTDVRKYQSQSVQKKYLIDDEIENIRLNALILLNDYNINKSRLKSTKVQIKASEIALDVIKTKYESGIKTFTDVIDQEEKLLNSKLDNFTANKDLLNTYFKILSLEGKLVKLFNDYIPKF